VRTLKAVIALGNPDRLAAAVRESGSRTPATHAHWNTAPHPTTPQAFALLVTEIANIILARSLTPLPEIQQSTFVDEILSTSLPDGNVSPVWKGQTNALLAEPVVDSAIVDVPGAGQVLDDAGNLALLWWNQLIDEPGFNLTADYRNPIVSVSGQQTDEETYLTVAVLHLLNLLSLLDDDTENIQLTRLKQLLSETSTVSDARVLQAAFVCLAIFVRK
jgi:phosphatidylinositol 4-kinase